MNPIRAKPSHQIRRDALVMAARKATAGCNPCVEAYVDLARQHGATDDEIQEALAPSENPPVTEQ